MRELTIEDLKKRARECLELARGFLEKEGDVLPVVIFGNVEMGEVPKPMDFSDDRAKRSTAMAIQHTIRESRKHVDLRVQYAILVTDSYMLDLKGEEYEAYRNGKSTSISEDPRRIEALTVCLGSEIGTTLFVLKYDRDAEGKPVFREVEEIDGGTAETTFFGTVWDEVQAEASTLH